MTELEYERKLYRERMARRAAKEKQHRKRPALPMHFGKRRKYEDDYLPPDDLTTSHRRVR